MIKTKTILLVDDEPEFLQLLRMRVESGGYHVRTASGGAEALAAAEAELPNLILLDMMMPGMDGLETLRRLRRSPATAGVPVIMLTARGESRVILKAQESGATDYLIKPCDSAELMAMIRRHA